MLEKLGYSKTFTCKISGLSCDRANPGKSSLMLPGKGRQYILLKEKPPQRTNHRTQRTTTAVSLIEIRMSYIFPLSKNVLLSDGNKE